MRRPELWAELMELTPEERIELVQDLWDSIGPEEVPSARRAPSRPEHSRYLGRVESAACVAF